MSIDVMMTEEECPHALGDSAFCSECFKQIRDERTDHLETITALSAEIVKGLRDTAEQIDRAEKAERELAAVSARLADLQDQLRSLIGEWDGAAENCSNPTAATYETCIRELKELIK